MGVKTRVLNRVAALMLIMSLLLMSLGSVIQYAFGSYSILGTNKALGSPILNDNFSSDNWNKWEVIVWGIFLSNFTIPFVDDYNSAFNLDAGYGSEGSGVKALEFGTGRDPANVPVIKYLLDHAVNQQSAGAVKRIYVSYNEIADCKVTKQASFNSSSSTSTSSGSTESSVPGDATDSVLETQVVRQATVRDLLFMDKKEEGTTWACSTDNSILPNNKILKTENYVSLVGIEDGNIPTFAINTSSGGHEIVLDYTDSYDLSIIQTVLSKGMTSDFKDEFVSMISSISTKPNEYLLYLDGFGNICTEIDGTYRVIIPAAANQYLTSNPSINLVNSLIFNSNTETISADNAIMNAGQSHGGFLSSFSGQYWQSGLPALSNSFCSIEPGQVMLFYDTDTIVYQDGLDKVGTDEVYTVDTGDLYNKLFSLDINDSITQDYAFKIEPANIYNLNYDGLTGNAKTLVQYTLTRSNQLVNLFNSSPDVKVLSTIQTDTGEVNLFNEPVAISVQLGPGMETGGIRDWWGELWDGDKKYNYLGIYRVFVNYVMQAYLNDINSTIGTAKSSEIKEALANSDNAAELMHNLIIDDNTDVVTTLFTSFITRRTDFYTVKDQEILKSIKYTEPIIDLDLGIMWQTPSGAGRMLTGDLLSSNNAFVVNKTVSSQWGSIDDNDPEGYGRSPFARTIKAYTTSEVMRSVANILGVREGTEFGVFSTYIYQTYLDWYGITNNKLASDVDESNLNTRIFDGNSDLVNIDIDDSGSAMSAEQKEQQILDWTYMMLDPTGGREYRSNMIISGISDWIYDNYLKIVYGDASSYYDTGTGVTSRNSTGFLTVSSYSNNFMTAWFVNNYSYFALILIAAFMVLIVVIGLIKRRKLSWFFVSVLLMVNMVLVIPSTGEIVPLVCNNLVQNMFKDKMSYWAISEGVTNATMEDDYVTGNSLSTAYLGGLSSDEQKQVINLVKNLNTLYTDRSLSIKQDISKKVTSSSSSNYEELQNLKTARWMLPMVMRQFTSDDSSANYVYVPLGDKFDDISNMYWYYKPEDANFVNTVNAKQTTSQDGGTLPKFETSDTSLDIAANRINYFLPYTDISSGYTPGDYAYKQQSYEKNPGNNVHTYSYMIDTLGLIQTNIPDYSLYDSYSDWAEAYASQLVALNTSNLEALERLMEQVAGEYNRFDRGTINQLYGYLWATENPLHYFYDGIKDSFEVDGSLGALIGDLQGTYVENDLGVEVRKSFMHANDTGYIRDILDLENMFYNMIPYLYAMQLYAEGYNGIGGVFKDGDLIDSYELYENNNKSWLFRSNWVTKMMENKDFHKSSSIGLGGGERVTVENMMLPSCYEQAGRPMVFSEAQMNMLNLSEADLSLVELKCVEINKEVSKQWTMLINYAAIPGITREVIFRQMAIDALLIFNDEFSPVGILNGAYAMYPNSIDLRSLSFDSVMKMLMLNVTKDTSYIYGDTMQTVVEDSDIFTSILLLSTAFICAFIIPLARNFLLGLIFFLGLWSLAWAAFRDENTKAKVSCGFVMTNFVFMGITIIYYLAFDALMALTVTDEVLSASAIATINTGNPVWCMIFVLLISGFYCVGIYKMVQMCVANYRDMGFEIYAGIANMAAEGISNKVEGLGAVVSGDGPGKSTKRKTSSSRGKKEEPVEVKSVNNRDIEYNQSDSGSESSSGSQSRKTKNDSAEYDSKSSYTDGRYIDTSMNDSHTIDDEIKKGKEISKKEK